MKNAFLALRGRAIRRHLRSFRALLLPAAIGLAVSSCDDTIATRVFEDVTLGSGLDLHRGMTHGAAWGDYDGDGLPDVYVTNHLEKAQLFHNRGNGHFEDVSTMIFAEQDLGGDKHGAAWADFDNDGRQDLVQMMGAGRGVGAEPKRLFINRGDHLENVAEAMSVANPYGRTRTPLWYDFNKDGRLDLFQGAEPRFDDKKPPFTFIQRDGVFVDQAVLPFEERNIPFCIVANLSVAPPPELVCRLTGKDRTGRVLETGEFPGHALDLIPATSFEDAAAGDFDNDGATDLYLTRKSPAGAVAFGTPSTDRLIADVRIDHKNVDKPNGFVIETGGALELKIKEDWPGNLLTPTAIHIGQASVHPSQLSFRLSSEQAGVQGFATHTVGSRAGVYIAQIGPNRWGFRVTAAHDQVGEPKHDYQQVSFEIRSAEPITIVKDPELAYDDESAPVRLLMNRGASLVDEGEKRINSAQATAGVNVVTADFDNDMDLDVFVLASGDTGKQPNQLLLNSGDGHFRAARFGGGAAGARLGVGDSVTTADFDRDGFVDLLVATGGSMGRSLGIPSEDGAYTLYRNIGNGNHWIELDLKGTVSNRDGIGAVVKLTTAGITQTRVQDGGIHDRGQNHQRLHFGLAQNQTADSIKIFWPSGIVQELTQEAADRILSITEPSAETVPANPGSTQGQPALQ